MRLTPVKLAKATRYNTSHARTTGWAQQFGGLMPVLGLQRPPEEDQFAEAVAAWQSQHPPLAVDGKLGPGTWRKMQALSHLTPGTATVLPNWLKVPQGNPSVDISKLSGPGPLWLQIAHAEMLRWDGLLASWGRKDKRRGNAEKHTDWDEQYFEAARKWNKKVHPPGEPRKANSDWCAAFVNWCLHHAGYSHTGSSGAHSFITNQWKFHALEEPRQGCIVVNGNSSGHGTHVAFLWSWSGLPSRPNGNVPANKGRKSMLGGNQQGRVRIKSYDKQLLSAKGTGKIRSPYLWPDETSPDNCNLLLPSARGHYCGNTYTLSQILE